MHSYAVGCGYDYFDGYKLNHVEQAQSVKTKFNGADKKNYLRPTRTRIYQKLG